MEADSLKPAPPVLAYTRLQHRRPNLLLANLMGMTGMLLGLIGLLCMSLGLLGLAIWVIDSNHPSAELGFAAKLGIPGLGICVLAYWLCRGVYAMANGTPEMESPDDGA